MHTIFRNIYFFFFFDLFLFCDYSFTLFWLISILFLILFLILLLLGLVFELVLFLFDLFLFAIVITIIISFSDWFLFLFWFSFFLGLLFGLGHIYRARAGKVLHTGSDTFVNWWAPTTRRWENTKCGVPDARAWTTTIFFLQRRPNQRIERRPFTTLVIEYTQLSYTGDSVLWTTMHIIYHRIDASTKYIDPSSYLLFPTMGLPKKRTTALSRKKRHNTHKHPCQNTCFWEKG